MAFADTNHKDDFQRGGRYLRHFESIAASGGPIFSWALPHLPIMQTEIVTSPAPPTMHIDSRARELADVILRGILQTQTPIPRDSLNANPPHQLIRLLDNPSDSTSRPSAPDFPSLPSCPDQSEEWVHELVPALPFVNSTDKLDVGQRPEAIKFSEAVMTMNWNPSSKSSALNSPTERISSPMEDPYGSKEIRGKTSSWKAAGFGAAEESEPPLSEAFGTFSAFESFDIPELLEVNKSNASSDNSMSASTSELMDDGFNTSREEASANLLLHPGEVLASQCGGNIPLGTVIGHPCEGTASLPAMESRGFPMLPGFVGMPADQAPIDSSSLKASSLFSVQSSPLFSTVAASSVCDKASMKELVYRAAAFKPIVEYTSMDGMIGKKKRKNVRISKDPQSVAARRRRERISYRIGILQRLVPGGTKMDTASMLDEAINYLKFLKMQVQSLERMEKFLNRMYWNHLFPGNNNMNSNNYVYNNSCNVNNNDFFNNNNNNNNNNNDHFYDLAATTATLRTETARTESTTATTSSCALPKNCAVTATTI